MWVSHRWLFEAMINLSGLLKDPALSLATMVNAQPSKMHARKRHKCYRRAQYEKSRGVLNLRIARRVCC